MEASEKQIPTESKFEIAERESLLAMIEGSVDSAAYQKLFVRPVSGDGEPIDITAGGERSCAYFVSSILQNRGLLERPHATITGLEERLAESGWRLMAPPLIEHLPPGAVIIWEPRPGTDGNLHEHIGFYMGEGLAISNNTEERVIKKHGVFARQRKITRAYAHPTLGGSLYSM